MCEVATADELPVDEWLEHEAPQYQPQNDAVVKPRHKCHVGNGCAQGDGKDVLESYELKVFDYTGGGNGYSCFRQICTSYRASTAVASILATTMDDGLIFVGCVFVLNDFVCCSQCNMHVYTL